jgi:hypothetical protein
MVYEDAEVDSVNLYLNILSISGTRVIICYLFISSLALLSSMNMACA